MGIPESRFHCKGPPSGLLSLENTVVRRYLASGSLEAEPDAGILQSSVQRVPLERGSRENIEPREEANEV